MFRSFVAVALALCPGATVVRADELTVRRVIPPLLNVLPTSWNNAISPYMPDSAGRSIFSLTHGAHSLAPGPGLALFVGYTAFVVAVAAVLFVRRDA